jgi:hypothetical protein
LIGHIWRAFPWEPSAAEGAPFAPDHLPAQSGQGRFDLPLSTGASAWYFAESQEHAVAEKLQELRGRVLRDDYLFERGRRLAIASAELEDGLLLADLCDAAELVRRGIGPDRLSYRDRNVTQAISSDLHEDTDLAGFRWWSSFFGEWHTVVLFSDRLADGALRLRTAEHIELASPALSAAAAALAIEIAR